MSHIHEANVKVEPEEGGSHARVAGDHTLHAREDDILGLRAAGSMIHVEVEADAATNTSMATFLAIAVLG